jgi:ABC-type lipoprotein release transport system permease subunit
MGAGALGEALRSQLFGVEPMEPSVLAATTTLFAICSWVALWWPARRAALVDPASLLRDE